jgi:hypothetical protein
MLSLRNLHEIWLPGPWSSAVGVLQSCRASMHMCRARVTAALDWRNEQKKALSGMCQDNGMRFYPLVLRSQWRHLWLCIYTLVLGLHA